MKVISLFFLFHTFSAFDRRPKHDAMLELISCRNKWSMINSWKGNFFCYSKVMVFVFGNFYIIMIIISISVRKKMLIFNFWYSFDNKGQKLPFWSFHWEIRIGQGWCRQRRHQRCGTAWRRPSCSPLRQTGQLSRRPGWTSWNGTGLSWSREV